MCPFNTNQSKLFITINAKIIMDPVFLLDRTRLVHQCIVHKTMTAKQANKLKPEAIYDQFYQFLSKTTNFSQSAFGTCFFLTIKFLECSNRIVFGCRTTKLQSQKRCHQTVFCISFLWQRGRTLTNFASIAPQLLVWSLSKIY